MGVGLAGEREGAGSGAFTRLDKGKQAPISCSLTLFSRSWHIAAGGLIVVCALKTHYCLGRT